MYPLPGDGNEWEYYVTTASCVLDHEHFVTRSWGEGGYPGLTTERRATPEGVFLVLHIYRGGAAPSSY